MERPAVAPRRGAGQRTAPEEQQALFEFLERPENRLGNNRVNFQLGVEAFGANCATVKKVYKKSKIVRQEASLLLPDEASVATEPPSTPHCDEVAMSPPTPRSGHEVEPDYEYGGDSPLDVTEPSDGTLVPDASTEEQPVAVSGPTGTDVDEQVQGSHLTSGLQTSAAVASATASLAAFSAVEREVLLYANTIADDHGGDADPVSLPDGNAISSPIPRISAFVPEVDVASELEALAADLEASNVYQAAMYAAQILGLVTELRKERQVVLKDIYAPHEDQGVEARMCNLISSAKRGERVYALIYMLTSTAFAKAFKTALENDADVKLILCRKEIKTAAAALVKVAPV